MYGNNKYLNYVKREFGERYYKELLFIVRNALVDKLQESLNTVSEEQLVVDGVLGGKTIVSLGSVLSGDTHIMSNVINESHNVSVTEDDRLESDLLNFLADAEGTTMHYNRRTEHSYTTPYGIYKYEHPHAEVVKYIDSLFIKYGLNSRSYKDVRAINSKFTVLEKNRIKTLALKFYKENFMDMRIINLVDRHVAITFLSIAINGGKSRGVKSIQKSIGTAVDGQFGKQSLHALSEYIENHTWKALNFHMLEYMLYFYSGLIKRNKKFGVYKNGWYNRLKKTACSLFTDRFKRIP